MVETMTSAIDERCQGWLPTSHPSVGPAIMTATMSTVSRLPAVVGLRPSPRTKNG